MYVRNRFEFSYLFCTSYDRNIFYNKNLERKISKSERIYINQKRQNGIKNKRI